MEIDVKADIVDSWKSKPICCPFCGSRKISEFAEWVAASTDDTCNIALVIEYQCNGNCEGRSFWT